MTLCPLTSRVMRRGARGRGSDADDGDTTIPNTSARPPPPTRGAPWVDPDDHWRDESLYVMRDFSRFQVEMGDIGKAPWGNYAMVSGNTPLELGVVWLNHPTSMFVGGASEMVRTVTLCTVASCATCSYHNTLPQPYRNLATSPLAPSCTTRHLRSWSSARRPGRAGGTPWHSLLRAPRPPPVRLALFI